MNFHNSYGVFLEDKRTLRGPMRLIYNSSFEYQVDHNTLKRLPPCCPFRVELFCFCFAFVRTRLN